VVVPLEACGWGYANSGCKLHATARRCDLPQVCDFFAPKGSGPEGLPWFPVGEGLASVRGLLVELGRTPESVCDAGCSTRDLRAIEQVLGSAPSGRFRLGIVRASELSTPPFEGLAMKPLLWALLFAMIPPVGLGDDPRRITVRVVEQPDFVKLAPAGDPPTSSAARITRVVDPATGKAYDPSNKELGCDPNRLRRTFRLEAPRVLLGEPILVEFRTELDGPGIWEEQFGGNSRGSLGRDDSFLFLMRHEDGT